MELSQEPLSGQTGLALVQLVALVHEKAPRQDQVADPPQEPTIFADETQTAQANGRALLQVPFTGHGFVIILQSSLTSPEAAQFQVDTPPHETVRRSGDI